MFLNNSNCYVKKNLNKNKIQSKETSGKLFQIAQNRDYTGLIIINMVVYIQREMAILETKELDDEL